MGFPDGSVVKNLLAVQKTQGGSLGWEDPLEKGMETHSSILAWEIPWQSSLMGYSPRSRKELDTTQQLAHTHNFLTQRKTSGPQVKSEGGLRKWRKTTPSGTSAFGDSSHPIPRLGGPHAPDIRPGAGGWEPVF